MKAVMMEKKVGKKYTADVPYLKSNGLNFIMNANF
jgi:hypothetical protein